MPIALTLEEKNCHQVKFSMSKIYQIYYILHFRPSQMPIHPSNLLTWFFPPIKSGSYMTSLYHRSMHRRCMNTSQNASKSFTKTLFKCSKPRSLIEGLALLGPPPGLCLDPLGTLSCPQTPCGIIFRPPNTKSWICSWYLYIFLQSLGQRKTNTVCMR